MHYKPVVAGNQSNGNAGTKACDDSSPDAGFKPLGDNEKKVTKEPGKEGGNSSNDQEKEDDSVNNTNNINTASDGNNTNNVNIVSSTVNTTGIEVNAVNSNTSIELSNDPNMPESEDIVYSDDYEDVSAEADMNNLNTFMPVSPILTTRIHKDHPFSKEQTIKIFKIACLLACLLSITRRTQKGLRSTSGIRACALRNFDLEVMEFESAQSNTIGKLPILKLGNEYIKKDKIETKTDKIEHENGKMLQAVVAKFSYMDASIGMIRAFNVLLRNGKVKDREN
ncbi:hypothetical protein Tco_1027526 [Tanacetum coccineum]